MNETTQLDSLAGIVNESTSMSMFELLAQGGILMIPIFLLSLVALYVVIERLLVLGNSKVQIDDFLTDVEGHMKRGEPRLAIQYCEDMDKPLSRLDLSHVLSCIMSAPSGGRCFACHQLLCGQLWRVGSALNVSTPHGLASF